MKTEFLRQSKTYVDETLISWWDSCRNSCDFHMKYVCQINSSSLINKFSGTTKNGFEIRSLLGNIDNSSVVYVNLIHIFGLKGFYALSWWSLLQSWVVVSHGNNHSFRCLTTNFEKTIHPLLIYWTVLCWRFCAFSLQLENDYQRCFQQTTTCS